MAAALIPAASEIISTLAPSILPVAENLAKKGLKKIGNLFFGSHAKKNPRGLMAHIAKMGKLAYENRGMIGSGINQVVNTSLPVLSKAGLLNQGTVGKITTANEALQNLTKGNVKDAFGSFIGM